jgi:seryl-tRNA synthetase
MHDIRWIRDNPEAFDRALESRGLEPQAEASWRSTRSAGG